MPELPEVETMRRGILGIIGARIENVERARCRRRPIAVEPSVPVIRRRLVGKTVAGVDRLGKRVIIRTTDEHRLVFEPRMTGLVLMADPPSQEHLRFRLTLSECDIPEVLFWDRRGLGRVELVKPDEFVARAKKWDLGPDALEIQAQAFQARMSGTHRPIKVALLDQSLVAGVGNLYASEILHRCQLHPAIPASQLSQSDYRNIHRAMRKILLAAIRYEGSTLSDGTYRNALNQAGGFQNQHQVYDRAGEPCQQCRRGTIERMVQAQRATFFCPRCQRPKSETDD